MSKSASLPAEQFEPFDPQSPDSGTPAWKQEVNQKLAAHRTRRGSPQEAADARSRETPKAASSRAAQAAARVAERYAKAPSYSQLLAGEARAVVRAAGAAAEAARHAQAAAQYVLAGLESSLQSGLEENAPRPAFWEPAPQVASHSHADTHQPAAYRPEMTAAQQAWAAEPPVTHVAPSRWQDEAPAQGTYDQAALKPRWEEALPVTSPPPERNAVQTTVSVSEQHDVWAEMRLHPDPSASNTRYDLGLGYGGAHTEQADEAELFPYDPVASATIEPVQHIPANLIEFPRELVATRKARPRLADGPYREAAQDSPQLSIFEVDPELLAPPVPISQAEPEAIAPPEWASIELDHAPEVSYASYEESPQADHGHGYLHPESAQAYPHSAYESAYLQRSYADPAYEEDEYGSYADEYASVRPDSSATDSEARSYAEPSWLPAPWATAETATLTAAVAMDQPIAKALPAAATAPVAVPAAELLVASVSDRLLAGLVDAALVTLAFLAAAVVVIASTAHPPTGRIALIATGCGLLLFGLLYQFLFLSYAEEGTPGMRYARIALCTFDDDNPSREQMRMRIPAMMLSALPLGLGMLWAIADSEKLGWHDRLTKTYQRKY